VVYRPASFHCRVTTMGHQNITHKGYRNLEP
jgi:hypothetical protein